MVAMDVLAMQVVNFLKRNLDPLHRNGKNMVEYSAPSGLYAPCCHADKGLHPLLAIAPRWGLRQG